MSDYLEEARHNLGLMEGAPNPAWRKFYQQLATAYATLSIAESLKELVVQGETSEAAKYLAWQKGQRKAEEAEEAEEYRTGVRERPDPYSPEERRRTQTEVLKERLGLMTPEEFAALRRRSSPEQPPSPGTTTDVPVRSPSGELTGGV